MTTVKCHNYTCENYNPEAGECKLSEIGITEDNECDEYYNYTETGDYDVPYYKAVENRNKGVPQKRKSKGKKIEYNGYVFFTEEDDRYGDNFRVTEQRTGFWTTFSNVKAMFGKFVDYSAKLPDVEDLEDETIDLGRKCRGAKEDADRHL